MKSSLLLPFCLAQLFSTAVLAEPVFSVQPKGFDFLSVEEGAVVEKVFTISNKGSEPLQVQKVAASCGCTVSTLASNYIAPGESTTLEVKLDTRGFYGGVQKKVFIFTNDPNQAAVALPITGRIKADIEVAPTVLDFGDVVAASGSTARRVKVQAVKGGGATKVSSGKFLDAKIVERGEILVIVKPDAPIGDLHDRLVISAVGVKSRTIIPVVAKIRGGVWAEPAAVSFGVMKKGTTASREVRLYGKTADAKIEGSSKALTINAKRVQGEAVIELSINSGLVAKEEFQERLKITTQTGEETFVPVLAVVAQER